MPRRPRALEPQPDVRELVLRLPRPLQHVEELGLVHLLVAPGNRRGQGVYSAERQKMKLVRV